MTANFTDEAQFQKHLATITEQHDREKEKLPAEIGKLTTQFNWLKKKLKVLVSRPNRMKLVEQEKSELALSM